MPTTTTRQEIVSLEERLREAELAPDPNFFQEHLDDGMVMVTNGEASSPKAHVVEAHQPGKGTKFNRVEMSDMQIIDHGASAVVTCKGTYEGPKGIQHLKFMRVWVKKAEGWRIVAGTVS